MRLQDLKNNKITIAPLLFIRPEDQVLTNMIDATIIWAHKRNNNAAVQTPGLGKVQQRYENTATFFTCTISGKV